MTNRDPFWTKKATEIEAKSKLQPAAQFISAAGGAWAIFWICLAICFVVLVATFPDVVEGWLRSI